MLNDWDRRLIRRYLGFYEQLADGRRHPATDAQRHFFSVTQSKATPRTQHEIAFTRYLAVQNLPVDPVQKRVGHSAMVESDPSQFTGIVAGRMLEAAERSIDEIESVQWSQTARRKVGGLLSFVKDKYRTQANRLGDTTAVASLWITALLSDREWSAAVGQWSGSQFNTLTNAYSKAMDGGFADGLVVGVQHISPSLHRLFDGNHTVWGAWDASQAALSADGFLSEVTGFSKAFLSDFSSTTGMPVITLTLESYETLASLVERSGISTTWLNDALHINAEEMLGSMIPGLAVLLNWNRAETNDFVSMLGGLTVASAVSASPIGGLLLLVAAARSFHISRLRHKQSAAIAAAFVEGGFLTGVVVVSGAVISGPVWIGMVAGLLLAILARKAGGEIQGMQVVAFLKDLMIGAVPGFSIA